jgi:transposase-like protein
MSDLSNPIFQDADEARKWLEARIWPEGPTCPKCGTVNEATLMQGKSHRPGLYQCNACREPFTVTVGTLYERSKIPLNKWLAATYLMMASKKGMSALQIGRMLGFSPKTAWFVCHRIRESLRESKVSPMGGPMSTVEADEAFIGGKDKFKHKHKRGGRVGGANKEAVFSLVERGGKVRSSHVEDIGADTLRPILMEQLTRDTRLMTDKASQYRAVSNEFRAHGRVDHSIGEYVRGDCHTNTVENYFSILKRGITGTYHHVSATHLKRYLAEFDYRYNERKALGVSDFERFTKSLKGIMGKRMTYRRIDQPA